MKRLFIVRHAKSSWDNSALSDFDRPLNARGLENAPRMAGRLHRLGVRPHVMLSSPAVRALATCEIFAGKLHFPAGGIKTDRALYHASPEQILAVLKTSPALEEQPEIVFLFGHNPGLTDFVNRLLNQDIDNVPTCGIVEAHLTINFWQDMTWGCGRLVHFDFPKKQTG